LNDKDAADVYRLMVGSAPDDVAGTFRSLLADPRVSEVTSTGLGYLWEQFGGPDAPGVRLAVAALGGDVPEQRVRAVAPAYVRTLSRT
jgi:hypothetical protein